MPYNISSEINAIKTDIPRLSDTQEEYLFSLVCFKYFFNDGSLTYRDFRECFVDGRSDGGIDLILVNESDSLPAFTLVQSKMIATLSNTQDVIDVFTKIDQTVRDFEDYRTSAYSRKLKRVYKNKWDEVEDESPVIDLVLFLGCDISHDRKEDIKSKIAAIEELGRYQCLFFTKSEIVEQIRQINEPKYYVNEGQINIDPNSGSIKYGTNGLLVNVSALSIRDLYDRYRDNGLFEQNFRYFIRNKRIDDSIKASLNTKRDEFWFLNNGIIIGCKDFRLDGDNVKLYDFSIINGCQTATLIGEYKGANERDDFYLPCKIVKPENEERFSQFISEIAEASNSQKPISDRDLKSNRPEQRQLQTILKAGDPKIYLEIKRGEQLLTRAQKRNIEDWQYLKNDLFGQLVLSFQHQSPGIARSKKSNIFSSSKTYDKIYKATVDRDNIEEMLRLNHFYTQYLNTKLENDDFNTPEQESVATNGRLVILAIIGFMLKHKRGNIDLLKTRNHEEWEAEITRDLISGRIFRSDVDDSEFIVKLNGLFGLIIHSLTSLYIQRSSEEKTVSNFFKLDSKYRLVILHDFITRQYSDDYQLNIIEDMLSVFI